MSHPAMPTMSPGFPSANPSKSFWHSEPSHHLLRHRSTDLLPETADVVVIGSGITGASVAWHLLNAHENRKGMNVVMLEAREACWGATGRNGGHCQPILYEHPDDPSIPRFELANFLALQALIAELEIDCEFYEQHTVHALYSEGDLAAARKSLAALGSADPGLAHRVRLVTETSELRCLRVPTAVGAIVTNIAGRLWPYKFVAGILERLLTRAAPAGSRVFNLQTNTTVTSVTRADDPAGQPTEPAVWKVATPRGSIATPHVVLATNAYTSALLPDFKDLIVPCRGQMSSLTPPTHISGPTRLPTSYVFLGPAQDDYLIQRPRDNNNTGEHLLFGGGRQHGPSLGLTDDSVVDPRVARYLRRALLDLLGATTQLTDEELSATHEWTGIMGFSRDAVPWVGPHPEKPGVFVAAGYTGHGMPNAWLCGRAVARMVRETMGGACGEAAVRAAVGDGELGLLPRAYVLDAERMERARGLESVERQDYKHMYGAEHVGIGTLSIRDEVL